MPPIERAANVALVRLKPKSAEVKRLKVFCDILLKEAAAIAKRDASPMLCGSTVKDTWMAGTNEIDLFLLFNPTVPRAALQKRGLDIGKKIVSKLRGKYALAYAEHPYVSAKVKHKGTTYDLDIVPCYDVANPAKIQSAVDRTPHHVRWVQKNLKRPDDVRLLKGFCKGARVYGADTKTQGFSGYLCELMIANFGKFSTTISEIAGWRAWVLFDPMHRKMNREKIFEKFKAPLIVIDAVDQNRNVAAAVSPEAFYKLVKAAQEFLKMPAASAFFQHLSKPYDLRDIVKTVKSRGTRWYLITFKRPDIVDDTLWPQLRRMSDLLQTRLHEADFEVLRKSAWADEKTCALVVEMKEWILPRIDKNSGPNIYTHHSDQFLKHYREHRVYIEGDNWIVEVPHKHTVTVRFLKDMLDKNEKELLKMGVPSKIAPAIEGAKLFAGGDAVKAMAAMPPSFRSWLRNWLETDLNIAR
jgi:tRNA nucleotidyltransferase (CCA-adding enzyme)